VLDAIGTSGHQGDRHPQLNVLINGKPISGAIRPLWAMDSSQRDNIVYLKAFAYGQGKNVEGIRQWWCIAVPDKFIYRGNNSISVSSDTSDLARPILFGDFVTPEGEPGGHNLSLRNFSWCKGFFADNVGEMRMDSITKPRGLTNIWFRAPKVRPRIRLLAIAGDAEPRALFAREVFLPDQSLNKSKVIADIALPESALNEVNRLAEELPDPVAVSVEVSADYKANKTSEASICMIENLDDVQEDMSGTQYAPLAPSVLKAVTSSQTVSFEDVLPLSGLAGEKQARLKQIRILLSGVNRWILGLSRCLGLLWLGCSHCLDLHGLDHTYILLGNCGPGWCRCKQQWQLRQQRYLRWTQCLHQRQSSRHSRAVLRSGSTASQHRTTVH